MDASQLRSIQNEVSIKINQNRSLVPVGYYNNPPHFPHLEFANLVYILWMSKNPSIPETWGIPDDQANNVREALSKKSIRPEDRVQKGVEELARDIATIEPEPGDWVWWVNYLLEKLEVEAKSRGKQADYKMMINYLREYLME